MALYQLRELGVTKRAASHRVSAGKLHPIHRGVYAVGHRNLTYLGRWMAAVLALGPGAVLSHHAATALWDLRPRPEGRIDVTVAARGRRERPAIRVHCTRSLDARDVTRRHWIPVTTVARTLLDYAEIARPQQLRLAVEAAISRDLLDARALSATIVRNPGRSGIAPLRAAVQATGGRAPWTQSEFERRFLAVVREAGLPEPDCNLILAGELVDVYWPQARLVVELDGYEFHRSRRSFEDDRRRDAKLLAAGLSVVRLTQPRLEDEPSTVIAELRALIGRAAA